VKRFIASFTCFFLAAVPLFASQGSGSGEEANLTHSMMILVIQLAILIFAAKAGGFLAKKIGMPSF
jgi:hypothetical protein